MTNKPLTWSTLSRDLWYVMELIGGNNEVAMFKIWDEKKMDAQYDTAVISEHNKRPIKTITQEMNLVILLNSKNVNMIKYVIE